MKKKFFDCGTHYFEGFKQFANRYNIDPTWDCFCYEANPHSYEYSKTIFNQLIAESYNIKHFNRAISNENSYIRINCAKDGETFTNQGSNILSTPPLVDIVYGGVFEYQPDSTLMVEAVDFSEIIFENCQKEDFVLIKLDIEGSEFSVLDKLIETRAYELITEIYVEFHERFFFDMDLYAEKKNNYKKIFSARNITLQEWI